MLLFALNAREGHSQESNNFKGIGWIGIETYDIEAAKHFFGEILEFESHTDYERFEMYQLPNGQFIEWIKVDRKDEIPGVYIGLTTSDIEKDKQQLEEEGLEFLRDIRWVDKEAGYGWTAFKDNNGTTIEYTQNPVLKEVINDDTRKLNIIGLSSIEYMIEDPEKTKTFYQSYFPLREEVNTKTKISLTHANGTPLHLLSQDTEEGYYKASHSIVGFEVEDLSQATRLLEEKGVELIGAMISRKESSVQYFRGLDGVVYFLEEKE